MYKNIIDPVTSKNVLLNSKNGIKILNNYLMQLGGAKSKCSKFHNNPSKCFKAKIDKNNRCLYRNANGGQCYMVKKKKKTKLNRRKYRKKTKYLNNVITSKLTKQNILKRCKNCSKQTGIRKWNELDCDWCIGKESVIRPYLYKPTNFKSLKKRLSNSEIEQNKYIEKVLLERKKHEINAEKVCFKNEERLGLTWDSKIKSCTKKYQTKECLKNGISKFKCAKYHTEQKKKDKK